MSQPHGVIIAGGRGERLGGVCKADLRLGGRRLIDRVADAMGPLATPLLVAVGETDSGRGPRTGAVAVTDLDGGVGGPLAGLVAAVAALQARGIGAGLLVSVAVDTPFLPSDFVAVMGHALGDAPAALAGWGPNFYPTNAIWRLEALADLPAQSLSGQAPGSLKALQAAMGARQVDWRARYAIDPFLNVNTMADLLQMESLAQHGLPDGSLR